MLARIDNIFQIKHNLDQEVTECLNILMDGLYPVENNRPAGSNRGGRRPLYAEHAKIAVRMKTENPLVDRAEIEQAMRAEDLPVPATKLQRQSMWNSIYHSAVWKEQSPPA
jgi:hypothetical protein